MPNSGKHNGCFNSNNFTSASNQCVTFFSLNNASGIPEDAY